jgi:Domain of unknown function (DUF6457)
MTVSSAEWLRRFAAEVGVPEPTEAEVEALLSLAGTAAHASERIAAPLSCWLVGRAGLTPELARAVAERVATDLE